MRGGETVKVLLDIDGVLADMAGGAFKLHGLPNPYHGDKQYTYDIAGIAGIEPSEFWGPQGEEFWAGLDPLPDAQNIVDVLESQFGRENICLLTSPIRTPGCIRGKMRWIAEHFPQFNRQFLIGPAKEFCAHENSILFDDYEGNIATFEEAGGEGFLVPAPWNHRFKEQPFKAIVAFLGGNCE